MGARAEVEVGAAAGAGAGSWTGGREANPSCSGVGTGVGSCSGSGDDKGGCWLCTSGASLSCGVRVFIGDGKESAAYGGWCEGTVMGT